MPGVLASHIRMEFPWNLKWQKMNWYTCRTRNTTLRANQTTLTSWYHHAVATNFDFSRILKSLMIAHFKFCDILTMFRISVQYVLQVRHHGIQFQNRTIYSRLFQYGAHLGQPNQMRVPQEGKVLYCKFTMSKIWPHLNVVIFPTRCWAPKFVP